MVCRHTGWTFDDVEASLDLHRLQALQQEWSRLPPLADLVAAFMGFEPTALPSRPGAAPPQQLEQQAAQQFAEFEAMFSALGGRVEG